MHPYIQDYWTCSGYQTTCKMNRPQVRNLEFESQMGINFLLLGCAECKQHEWSHNLPTSHKGHMHATNLPDRTLCSLLPTDPCFVDFQHHKLSLFPFAILSLSIILQYTLFHSWFLLLHGMFIWLICVVSSCSLMISLPNYILLHKLPQCLQSISTFNALLGCFHILLILSVPRNILGYLFFKHLN